MSPAEATALLPSLPVPDRVHVASALAALEEIERRRAGPDDGLDEIVDLPVPWRPKT